VGGNEITVLRRSTEWVGHRLLSGISQIIPARSVQNGAFLFAARIKVYLALSSRQAMRSATVRPMVRDTLYKAYLISAGAVTVAWTAVFIWIVAGAFRL